MKTLIMSLGFFAAGVLQIAAQEDLASVKVAIVAPERAMEFAQGLLTVELSTKEGVHLLEREEIERAYGEQGLSAVSSDVLKLGQILGADGLVVLELVREGTNSIARARLVAVRPGVVLGSVSTPWPVSDQPAWVAGLVRRLEPLLPKLGVLPKEAIPISVVQLRSAVRSQKAEELEQQLTLLTIERLTRVRELFVLERRSMELLSAEVELKGIEESDFWKGSYLLEGVIDRDSFSEDLATVHARLSPPQGGTAVELVVSGPRTDPAALIDHLAGEVLTALNRESSASSWDAGEEGEKFYQEACWALKWGLIKEAQAAAESAWALGKQDLDCAVARIRSYIPDVVPAATTYGQYGYVLDPRLVSETRRELSAKYPHGLIVDETQRGNLVQMTCFWINTPPEPASIRRALHLLRLYEAFTRSLPKTEPDVKSEWCLLGTEVLTAASKVLQLHYLLPNLASAFRDDLSLLRQSCRSVAARISESPSVRDSYFVGNRAAGRDELAASIGRQPNIFQCKLDWGGFWQETPEECLQLYRDLMSSPVFGYIHHGLWFRSLPQPRVTAWSKADRERVPIVWRGFLQELASSTNYLLQMEGSALAFIDARTRQEMEVAHRTLFEHLFPNEEAITSHNVELFYLNWGLDALYSGAGASHIQDKLLARFKREVWPHDDELEAQYLNEYRPRLESMNRARSRYSRLPRQTEGRDERFETQKEYLTRNPTFNLMDFSQVFRGGSPQLEKEQAKELVPLLAAYRSNLVVLNNGKSAGESAQLQMGIRRIQSVERQIDQILHPLAETSTAAPRERPARLATITPASVSLSSKTPVQGKAPQALLVTNYFSIPMELFREGKSEEGFSDLHIAGHRVYEGKLWLDFRYRLSYQISGQNAFGYEHENRAAAVIFDPQNGEWNSIQYPETDNPGQYNRLESFELFDRTLYLSGPNYLRKFDLNSGTWTSLSVPWEKYTKLYSVGQRLYAANDEAIIQILDGGRRFESLASCRRRPTSSSLDSLSTFGDLTIFPGKDDRLMARILNRVYAWDGNDWTLDQTGNWLKSAELAGALDEPPAIMIGSRILTYEEKLKVRYADNKRLPEEVDGRHADLISRNIDGGASSKLALRFDPEKGPLPSPALAIPTVSSFGKSSMPWLDLTADWVFIGHHATPGIWGIPRSQLEASVAKGLDESAASAKELKAALAEIQGGRHVFADLLDWAQPRALFLGAALVALVLVAWGLIRRLRRKKV